MIIASCQDQPKNPLPLESDFGNNFQLRTAKVPPPPSYQEMLVCLVANLDSRRRCNSSRTNLISQVWSCSLCISEEKSSLLFSHRRGVSGTIGGAHSWPSNDQYVRIPGTLSKLPQLQSNFGFHTGSLYTAHHLATVKEWKSHPFSLLRVPG